MITSVIMGRFVFDQFANSVLTRKGPEGSLRAAGNLQQAQADRHWCLREVASVVAVLDHLAAVGGVGQVGDVGAVAAQNGARRLPGAGVEEASDAVAADRDGPAVRAVGDRVDRSANTPGLPILRWVVISHCWIRPLSTPELSFDAVIVRPSELKAISPARR
ncbi:hypothetical protein [Nonomuraea sp. CA-141351]|uniref:hypothetical protein n=1 Tax=Nonomuraea sp. CA-141351 TaxID=3239996 RepID=UPI003D8EE70F